MADSIDHPMANGQDEASHLPISEDEEKVLALYDRIQQLRLEIAIINAQRSHQPGLFLRAKTLSHKLTYPQMNHHHSHQKKHARRSWSFSSRGQSMS